jgi:hypothetical protein
MSQDTTPTGEELYSSTQRKEDKYLIAFAENSFLNAE